MNNILTTVKSAWDKLKPIMQRKILFDLRILLIIMIFSLTVITIDAYCTSPGWHVISGFTTIFTIFGVLYFIVSWLFYKELYTDDDD